MAPVTILNEPRVTRQIDAQSLLPISSAPQ
jgi:hypothetical protein